MTSVVTAQHPDARDAMDVVATFFQAVSRNDRSLLAATVHPAITLHVMSGDPPRSFSGWDALVRHLPELRPPTDAPEPVYDMSLLHADFVLALRRCSTPERFQRLMVFALHHGRVVEAWDLPVDVAPPHDGEPTDVRG